MGYQTTGFFAQPRQKVLVEAAERIMSTFQKDMDKEVQKAIKSLGRENIRLSNLFFQALLALDHPALNGDEETRVAFMMLLCDFLKMTGYVETAPVVVDYRENPMMTFDDVIIQMSTPHMPAYSATDLGGQYATIDNLMRRFPVVIRDYARVATYRKLLAQRFRMWLADIGFRMFERQPVSQQERTAVLMYAKTRKGGRGYSSLFLPGETEPIAALQNDKGDLIREAGELYKTSCLPGPCTNHFKVLSDGTLERLTMYLGQHVSSLDMSVAFEETFGDFIRLDSRKVESITWSAEDQLVAISASSAYFMVDKARAFSLRMPVMVYGNDAIPDSMIPDLPEFEIIMRNEKDISEYDFEWYSTWRQRRVNSRVNEATMEIPLVDIAFQAKSFGSTQIAQPTLEGFGVCRMTPQARAKIVDFDSRKITQTFLLPNGTGLVKKEIDMTPFYSRRGTKLLRPAFSEGLLVPLKWFGTPQPAVVDYVAAATGMLADERNRFADVISMFHNVARYELITGKRATPSVEIIARAMLKSTTK